MADKPNETPKPPVQSPQAQAQSAAVQPARPASIVASRPTEIVQNQRNGEKTFHDFEG